MVLTPTNQSFSVITSGLSLYNCTTSRSTQQDVGGGFYIGGYIVPTVTHTNVSYGNGDNGCVMYYASGLANEPVGNWEFSIIHRSLGATAFFVTRKVSFIDCLYVWNENTRGASTSRECIYWATGGVDLRFEHCFFKNNGNQKIWSTISAANGRFVIVNCYFDVAPPTATGSFSYSATKVVGFPLDICSSQGFNDLGSPGCTLYLICPTSPFTMSAFFSLSQSHSKATHVSTFDAKRCMEEHLLRRQLGFPRREFL
jgi:hypothetical protein